VDLEHPVETLDQALFVVMRLLKEVCAALDAAIRVAAVLRVRWRTTENAVGGRDFSIPEPTAREKILFTVVETYLSGVKTDAPLSRLEVEALPIDPGAAQKDFFEIAARDPFRFREVVARVRGLLGDDAFGVPVRLPTYRPDGYRVDPPEVRLEVHEDRSPFAERSGPALRKFRPSRSVEVEVRNGVPVYCSGKDGRGRVLRCRGPFRLSGDWWDPLLAWSREEWDVEWPVRGSFRRLVRDPGNGWEWDGIYD